MKTTVSATQAHLLNGDGSVTIKTTKKPGKSFPYYPPTENIPGSCEISFEDEKGDRVVRKIQYSPGMKSIFVDEWTDKEKEARPKRIKLTNGFYIAPRRDTNLIKYLELCGYNAGNDSSRMPDTSALFEIIDYEQKAKEANEEEDKKIQALYFANHAPLEDVRAFALATSKTRAEAEGIMKKTEQLLRYSLRDVAKRTPEMFVEALQSSALKNKIMIHKALDAKTIELRGENSLAWAGGDVIISSPQGMNVIDWFADLSEKKEEFKDALNDIKITLIDNVEEKVESKSWEEQLLESALANEKIERVASFYTITDKDDEVVLKEKGKVAILKAIKTNKENILSYIV
jgi:hypothetical protein